MVFGDSLKMKATSQKINQSMFSITSWRPCVKWDYVGKYVFQN